MKKLVSKTFVTRSISVLTPVVMIVVELTLGRFGLRSLCADLLASGALLLLFPLSFENSNLSLYFAAGLCTVFVVLSAMPFFVGYECFLVALSGLVALIAYGAVRTANKYANVRTLFRADIVWCALEEYSRMFYVMIYAFVCVTALTACRYEAPAWVLLGHVFISTVFVGACFLRSYTGSSFLIGRKREKSIRHIIKGNLRNVPEYGGPDDHMSAMYGKVLRYMESKKPFLSESFTVDDLADAVFSNKVYLSKAINYYSGRNFRQFVNYYRVMYATDMMKKDRHLKVMELAQMCGFHSIVTFNMAFKLYMNMTPSGYYGVLAGRSSSDKARRCGGVAEPAMAM